MFDCGLLLHYLLGYLLKILYWKQVINWICTRMTNMYTFNLFFIFYLQNNFLLQVLTGPVPIPLVVINLAVHLEVLQPRKDVPGKKLVDSSCIFHTHCSLPTQQQILSFLHVSVLFFPVWVWNRLISAGLESVLRHSEKFMYSLVFKDNFPRILK